MTIAADTAALNSLKGLCSDGRIDDDEKVASSKQYPIQD